MENTFVTTNRSFFSKMFKCLLQSQAASADNAAEFTLKYSIRAAFSEYSQSVFTSMSCFTHLKKTSISLLCL